MAIEGVYSLNSPNSEITRQKTATTYEFIKNIYARILGILYIYPHTFICEKNNNICLLKEFFLHRIYLACIEL